MPTSSAPCPSALAREGVEARTLIPGYPQVLSKLGHAERVHDYPYLFGGYAEVLAARAEGLDLFVLKAPHLYDRPGNPYLGPDGRDWPDNAQRYAALSRVGADIAKGAATSFMPDVAQAHDWQAALAAAYLHYDGGPRPGTVVTVHNLAFQGHYPVTLFPTLGLPADALTIDGVEYFGGVSYLKAGLQARGPHHHGIADLRARDHDARVRHGARRADQEARLGRRRHPQWHRRPGVEPGDRPDPRAKLFGAARRSARASIAPRCRSGSASSPIAPRRCLASFRDLRSQKGLDLLLTALPQLLDNGGQLALLGAGEKLIEDGFAAAASQYPGRVACISAMTRASRIRCRRASTS